MRRVGLVLAALAIGLVTVSVVWTFLQVGTSAGLFALFAMLGALYLFVVLRKDARKFLGSGLVNMIAVPLRLLRNALGTMLIALGLSALALAFIPAVRDIVFGHMTPGLLFPPASSIAGSILQNEVPPADYEGPPTSGAIAYAAEDYQVLGGRGEGLSCSLPDVLDKPIFGQRADVARPHAPISLQMRQACAHHDYCYRHGAATYGYSQADCDYLLQGHAFRLCKFFTGNAQGRQECHEKARLVTLGVRLGGSKNFRNLRPSNESRDFRKDAHAREAEHEYSTYFEFDPYPVRSLGYDVARIADAPAAFTAHGLMQKALYVFRVRPSGMRVTIQGWKAIPNKDKTKPPTINADCQQTFYIPGGYGHITTPPVVARVPAAKPAPGPAVQPAPARGTTQDWFVSWQRAQLQQTGGQFAVLSPADASLVDWSVLARSSEGATSGGPSKSVITPLGDAGFYKCDPALAVDLGARQASQNVAPGIPARSAWLDLRVTAKPDVPRDDFNISEFYTVPADPRADGKFRIVGFDRTPCQRDAGDRHLCFHELGAATGDIRNSFQSESFRALRDRKAATATTQPVRDNEYQADIYRSFVAPPLLSGSGGTNGHTLVMWLRRGTAEGRGYRDSAMLRRHSTGDPGKPATYEGEVKLNQMLEEHEPVALLGRNTSSMHLLSISVDRLGWSDDSNALKRKIRLWPLPETYTAEEKTRRELFADGGVDPIFCRDATDKAGQDGKKPVFELGPDWLVRAPVVVSRKAHNTVLLSRAMPESWQYEKNPNRHPSAHNVGSNAFGHIDLARLDIFPDGTCRLGREKSFTIADKTRGHNDLERALDWRARLRARPLLVVDLEGSGASDHVLIPDFDQPADSFLVDLPETPAH